MDCKTLFFSIHHFIPAIVLHYLTPRRHLYSAKGYIFHTISIGLNIVSQGYMYVGVSSSNLSLVFRNICTCILNFLINLEYPICIQRYIFSLLHVFLILIQHLSIFPHFRTLLTLLFCRKCTENIISFLA
jgi:hypothetical protein